jgi:RimJ/RimL family protein N-acetyltransferase
VAAPLPFPDPPLAGPGFVLRAYREDDVETYAAAVAEPETARWLNSYASGDAASDIRFAEAGRAAGEVLVLTIADAGTDAYLGMIALLPQAWDTAELAYLVVPEARGRGIAPAAVGLLGDWAIEHLGVQRLQLRIDPENEASHRVAVRAGYRREGIARSSFALRGERRDSVMYSLLPSDPRPG